MPSIWEKGVNFCTYLGATAVVAIAAMTSQAMQKEGTKKGQGETAKIK